MIGTSTFAQCELNQAFIGHSEEVYLHTRSWEPWRAIKMALLNIFPEMFQSLVEIDNMYSYYISLDQTVSYTILDTVISVLLHK